MEFRRSSPSAVSTTCKTSPFLTLSSSENVVGNHHGGRFADANELEGGHGGLRVRAFAKYRVCGPGWRIVIAVGTQLAAPAVAVSSPRRHRHDRACPGHPRRSEIGWREVLPGGSAPPFQATPGHTVFLARDVDDRDKPGHDGGASGTVSLHLLRSSYKSRQSRLVSKIRPTFQARE